MALMLVLMLLYFLMACGACWLLLFARGRTAMRHTLHQSLRQFGRRGGTLLGAVLRRGAGHTGALRRRAGGSVVRLAAWLRRHRWAALAALPLLCLPPLMVWLLGGHAVLGGFSQTERATNEQIRALLSGEQLAPPAPLPPLLFTTLEVAQVRPLLVSASRNWELLDPHFAQRLLTVFKVMKEVHGIDMVLLEGYRSPERQNLLAAAGPNVTNARAFQSYHQYGLAADCAFFRDGKLLISEKDPWAMRAYRLYGETAEAAGLGWGGRWAMMDFGHTELPLPGTLRR